MEIIVMSVFGAIVALMIFWMNRFVYRTITSTAPKEYSYAKHYNEYGHTEVVSEVETQ